MIKIPFITSTYVAHLARHILLRKTLTKNDKKNHFKVRVFDGKLHQIKDQYFFLKNDAKVSKGRLILISNKAVENPFVCCYCRDL